MNYITSSLLRERGFVILDRHDQSKDPKEWLDLEYVNWKSSGDTRFAPLASANGSIEADGFWSHEPPRADKDGVWIQSQVERAPVLAARAKESGANVGRCRVIELQPNTYADAIYNLHQDDNNRLNPQGTGWVVRGYYNLTDDPDSFLLLREDRYDPSTELRIPLPAGTQVIVDTQRFWHATWHSGIEPRYSLITSWESGPELDSYIARYNGSTDFKNTELDAEMVSAAQDRVQRKLAERAEAIANRNGDGLVNGGDGGI